MYSRYKFNINSIFKSGRPIDEPYLVSQDGVIIVTVLFGKDNTYDIGLSCTDDSIVRASVTYVVELVIDNTPVSTASPGSTVSSLVEEEKLNDK